MTPYDERQVIGFIDDATEAYVQAHHTPDPHALVWVARMQFDAGELGYPASRSKHLNEVRVALGLSPAPVTNDMPPNIVTMDRSAVRLRVVYWLARLQLKDPADLWVGYVMDDAHEGHTIGWTADFYWPNKMADAAGQPPVG